MNSFQNHQRRTKKGKIKFFEDEEQDRFNLMQQDLLPFSVHYNVLIHPKNLGIVIPEIMKQNEKWVKEEKKLLDKHINMIIVENSKNYRKQKRAYDHGLASFIKKNYDNLSQKRWKYIL